MNKLFGSTPARALWVTLLASLLGLVAAQSITVAINEGIPGFDPAASTRSVAASVYPNIFDSLISKDADGTLVPALATSWAPEGATALRLQLREGVTWHDGSPFTAADVEFSIERLAFTPELVRHGSFAGITDVEVVNDFEVIIHTSSADPLLPNNLAANGGQILPKAYFEAVGVDAASVSPIGTGPYRFVEYRPDDRLILAAFDDHWRGQAAYRDVVFRVIGENTTAVSELVTGGVQITSVAATDLGRVEASSIASIVTQPTNRVVHWTFNVSDDQVTSNPLVREAIDYALDPTVFIEVLENGYGTPTRIRTGVGDSFAPEGYYGTYLYDPEHAIALLAEAGYGPGELQITLGGSSDASDRAELTAAMLEAVGIDVTIQLYESSVWTSRYWNTGEFTNMAAVGSSNSTFDYGNILTDLVCPTGAHSQRSHWCHEEFSDLVNAANAEVDVERRQALLDQAAEILVSERPQAYLYNSVAFMGIADAVDWSPVAHGILFMFDAKPRGN